MYQYVHIYQKNNSIKHVKIKLFIIVICLILSLLFTIKIPYYVSADNNEDSISTSVNEIIEKIDFAQLQTIVDDLDDINIFQTDIKDKVSNIINGKYFTNYSSVFTGIMTIAFADIRNFLPILFTLIAIGLLSSILINLNSTKSSTGIQEVIRFVCFATAVMVVLASFKKMLINTSGVLESLTKQIQIVFPILITLLTSIGSLSSVAIYRPLVAVLSMVSSFVFSKFLYPIFILILLLTIVGNLSSSVKLNKLTEFFSSLFKWSVGIVFTLFTGFLSIQGISAGKFDNISIKATKFAVKSYIPLIGGYISDGMDFIVLGSVLVKNTIGLIGVLVIFVTIISPVLHMLLFKFTLQLASGILEVSSESKISNFLSSCSKLMIYPIVILLAVAFMYVITIALIMCTANIF